MKGLMPYYRVLERSSIPTPATFDQIFSFRKINPSYSGPCITVRRSSDDTTQNIGFVSDVLDESSLLSFVGSGDGFITTWFNQIGSINFVQSTNSLQPKIVISGVVQKIAGKPCIKFDDAGQFLVVNSSSIIIPRLAFGDQLSSQIHYVIQSTKTAVQTYFSSESTVAFGLAPTQASTNTLVYSQWARSGYSDPGDNYTAYLNAVKRDPFTNRGDVYTKTTGLKIISESNCGYEAGRLWRLSGYPQSGVDFIGEIAEILIYSRPQIGFRNRQEIIDVQNWMNQYYSIY
jgi:hypothetical protein